MSDKIKNTIQSLDDRIISQAEEGDLQAVKETVAKKKQLNDILTKRKHEETNHQKSKHS
jgi:hypothetical protein